jgi:hypothetical protein
VPRTRASIGEGTKPRVGSTRLLPSAIRWSQCMIGLLRNLREQCSPSFPRKPDKNAAVLGR